MNGEKANPLLSVLGAKLRLLGDLLAVNLLWIVCSVPIVTIGAASSAAYAVLLRRVMKGEIPVFRTWCKAFRENFLQALAMEGILALIGVALWADVQMVFAFSGGIRWAYAGACAVLALLFLAVALFALPQQALFRNSLKNILKNGFALAFCYPAKFLLCCLFWAVSVGLLLLLPWELVDRIGFFWLMWGLSGPAWFTSRVLISIFSGLTPDVKESEDNDHES